MKDIGDYVNLLNEFMIFNNQHISSSNIYITCDLAFFNLFLRKEHSSPHWCTKCKSPSKHGKVCNHSIGDEWILETLKLMSHPGG